MRTLHRTNRRSPSATTHLLLTLAAAALACCGAAGGDEPPLAVTRVDELVPERAALLLELAGYSYRARPDAAAAAGALGFKLLERVEADGMRADLYAPVAEGLTDPAGPAPLVVAFRGTAVGNDAWESYLNITTDLDALRGRQLPEAPGTVHSGFANGLDALWSAPGTSLAKLLDRKRRYWLTGHSLGGALATLAGPRLGEAAVLGTYTFGSPRVGDRTFEAAYDATHGRRHLRFAASSDVVPHLAPAEGWERDSLSLGGILSALTEQLSRYAHVGRFCWYRPDGSLHPDSGGRPGTESAKLHADWQAAFLETLSEAGLVTGLQKMFGDHFSYFQLLRP